MKIKSILLLSIFIIGCAVQKDQNQYKQLVSQYVEYWNTGDFDGIEEILHREFELRMTPTYDEIGRASCRERV